MSKSLEHIDFLQKQLSSFDKASLAVNFVKEIKDSIDNIDYSSKEVISRYQSFITYCINFYNYRFTTLTEDLFGTITKIPIKNIFIRGHLVKSLDFLYFKFCYNKIFHQRKIEKISVLDFSEFFIHLVYNPSYFSLISLTDIKEIHNLFGSVLNESVNSSKINDGSILFLSLQQLDYYKSFNSSKYLIDHIEKKLNLDCLIEELQSEINFHKKISNQNVFNKIKQIPDFTKTTFKELEASSIYLFDLIYLLGQNGYYRYDRYTFGTNTNPRFVLSFYGNITQYLHTKFPNKPIDNFLAYIIEHYNNRNWEFSSNNIGIVESKLISYQSVNIDSELNRIFFDIPVSKIANFKEAIENKVFEEFYSYYYNDKFWKQLIVLLAYDAYHISQKGEFDFGLLLKDFLMIYFGTQTNKKSS